MRVTQVTCAHAPGAASAAEVLQAHDTLRDWNRALLEAGVAHCATVQRFQRDERLSLDGVEYLLVRDGAGSWARPWSWQSRVAAAAARTRPDVVHLNGLIFPGASAGLRRALPASTALVVQDHAATRPPRGRLRRWLWRWGLQSCDAFLFTAPEQVQPWRDAGVISPRQAVFLVPEASRDIEPLEREQARERSGLRGHPAVLWVGHLDANKDPLTALEGFARASSVLGAARLTMVFRGVGLRGAVERRLAEDRSLAARVELRGPVAPALMAELFSAADLFLLGSHREGSGFALLEALACGALPVVTDIPSFRALAGGVGELWAAGHAEACERALLRAGARFGEGQRREVRAHFERELSWPAVARRALEAYARARESRLLLSRG